MHSNFLEEMKIKEVIGALERFAPLPLQDGFDNAGLQIGLTEAEATGALLCLDVTEAVVDEAVTLGYNLIVSHHPLIFKGYKSITGRDYVERCILKAIRNDIAIYSAHTNLDNYDSCSYNVEGEGMFRALKGASPFCGEVGELHKESEIRIETILPDFKKATVVKALLGAHPYEEPAFDFYPLKNDWAQVGAGVIGELKKPETELEFLKNIKKTFEVGCVKHTRLSGRLIQTVALCGGAGAFLLPRAVGKADVFITGEVKYHDYFNYENDILIAEIGHYESEQYTKEIFYSIIREMFPALEVQMTRVNTCLL